MEPVPFIIASVIGTALVSAVLALWRDRNNDKKQQSAANARCEVRGERLEAEVVATKSLVIDLYRENAKAADARAAESARRELQMAETARVCARVLKRYANTPVPPEGSGETSALVPIVKG